MHWLGTLFASISMFLGVIFGLPSHGGASAPQRPALLAPAQQQQRPSATQTSSSQTTSQNAPSSAGNSQASNSSSTNANVASGSIDVHAISLGDGKVSTSPRVGYVYSCQTSFSGGGAQHAGDWIQGSTWDLTKKISVEGSVSWPSATFSNTVTGSTRTLTGNGLPVNETTGIFPIQSSDPAYQYDRNPNSIQAQSVSVSLPASPTFAASPSCVPMGAIGYALDGVAIYNALDDGGRDAVAHEVQDSCDGHPQSAGQYHYHGPSPCMPNYYKSDTVVGYALDGFPITSMYAPGGGQYTNADLDACHGTTSTYTDENGSTKTGYHYVLTQEYPYTLGCFMGTPHLTRPAAAGAMQGGQTTPLPPPPIR